MAAKVGGLTAKAFLALERKLEPRQYPTPKKELLGEFQDKLTEIAHEATLRRTLTGTASVSLEDLGIELVIRGVEMDHVWLRFSFGVSRRCPSPYLTFLDAESGRGYNCRDDLRDDPHLAGLSTDELDTLFAALLGHIADRLE